jgi:hemoglobin
VTTQPLYDRVGGAAFFIELVDRFYDGVALDALLRPMYPEDLTDSRRHLALFLMQYWGGPTTYGDERGHPRLRRRHAPHVVDAAARDAWLAHMRAALASMEIDAEDRAALTDYLDMAANQLRNA